MELSSFIYGYQFLPFIIQEAFVEVDVLVETKKPTGAQVVAAAEEPPQAETSARAGPFGEALEPPGAKVSA